MTKDEEDVVDIIGCRTMRHSHCVGVLVVPAMTVAYRTNSIKIPKTTTIYVYIYRYIHKHTIKHNTQLIFKREKGKATHV